MKQQQYNKSMLKLAPRTLVGLAALAVLALVRLPAVPLFWSASNSQAAREGPQQPAVALHGVLRTCPLPGYCYHKLDSSSEELRPSEPLITAYRTALKQYMATKAFEASAAAKSMSGLFKPS